MDCRKEEKHLTVEDKSGMCTLQSSECKWTVVLLMELGQSTGRKADGAKPLVQHALQVRPGTGAGNSPEFTQYVWVEIET